MEWGLDAGIMSNFVDESTIAKLSKAIQWWNTLVLDDYDVFFQFEDMESRRSLTNISKNNF